MTEANRLTRHADLTDLLADLVAIDSINPDLVSGGSGEELIGRTVAEWMARAGLRVTVDEVRPGRRT
jgi:acetylornithine deacetylase